MGLGFKDTHLQDLATVLDTGVVHTGLVHAQGDAVQQDDQDGDTLEPCAVARTRLVKW